jgi:hypothetical protein
MVLSIEERVFISAQQLSERSVVRMGKIINANKYFILIVSRKRVYLWGLQEIMRILLKGILKEYGAMLWIGLKWLME